MNNQQQQKIVQYLNEAHASELALVRQLQAQIAMTPGGQYRDGLESHLERPAATPGASSGAWASSDKATILSRSDSVWSRR